MFSSVSDKLKSFIFQPTRENTHNNLSKKRKRNTDVSDGDDPDLEIIEVKKARKESTGTKVWSYLTLPVQKMAEWVRQRGTGSFNSEFAMRELPENSRWKQGPPRMNASQQPVRPTVKVPTTNGGSLHSQMLGRQPLHRHIPSVSESSHQPHMNGEQSNTEVVPQQPRYQRMKPSSHPRRNKGLFTAQECVRLDEKNRYRELLQTFAPSMQLNDQTKDSDRSMSTQPWLLPSKFSHRPSSSCMSSSYLGHTNSISRSSLLESDFKSTSTTSRPHISSTLLTSRRKSSAEGIHTAPISRTVTEKRDFSKLRIHPTEVIIPDEEEVRKRISPSPDIPESPAFKTSEYAKEDWIKNLTSKFASDVRERNRQIAEAEIKKTFFEERRKVREESLEYRIREQMRLEEKEPPVLEEPPPIELEPEEEVLPELTSDMKNVIASAVQAFPPGQVIAEGYRLQISRKDMATLSGLNWLNDEIINFYMNMLMERGEQEGRAKVYAFNTFFYPKLTSGGHSAVRRWTRKTDVFSHDYLLVPVHLGVHWCLAVIDLKAKKIRYFDSMGGQNKQCLQALRKYLQDESMDKKKTKFDLTGWELLIESDIPQQMNGSDCGMFACKFAEYITREAPITFTQENMPYFRKRMVYEIVKKKLLQ